MLLASKGVHAICPSIACNNTCFSMLPHVFWAELFSLLCHHGSAGLDQTFADHFRRPRPLSSTRPKQVTFRFNCFRQQPLLIPLGIPLICIGFSEGIKNWSIRSSNHLFAHVRRNLLQVRASMMSRRWPRMPFRWSHSSHHRTSTAVLRMSKLRPSTLACARSSDLFTQGGTIASPSFKPSVVSTFSSLSTRQIRSKSSSSGR